MKDATFFIPPGLTQDDIHSPSTIRMDFGRVIILYVPKYEFGGIWRKQERFWAMWYPVNSEDFGTAAALFLETNGLFEEAERECFAQVPPVWQPPTTLN